MTNFVCINSPSESWDVIGWNILYLYVCHYSGLFLFDVFVFFGEAGPESSCFCSPECGSVFLADLDNDGVAGVNVLLVWLFCQALEATLFGELLKRALNVAHNAALVNGELPGESCLLVRVSWNLKNFGGSANAFWGLSGIYEWNKVINIKDVRKASKKPEN